MTKSTKPIISAMQKSRHKQRQELEEERQTAGELELKAKSCTDKVDPLDVTHGMFENLHENLLKCAELHDPIINEEEYFICLAIADDPMLKTVKRHKYYAWLFLPTPRPNQVVFLYNKKHQTFRRLWSLPSPAVMATISETPWVSKEWQSTKRWSDSFYNQTFWEDIRLEHGIDHLSEYEYKELHRDKLLDASANEIDPLISDTFDFSKVKVNQVADKKELIL